MFLFLFYSYSYSILQVTQFKATQLPVALWTKLNLIIVFGMNVANSPHHLSISSREDSLSVFNNREAFPLEKYLR